MKKDKKFFLGHDRFAEERLKKWATQQQAADHFGISRVTWGQCERGNATPSGDVLAGMAHEGLDVTYILTGQRSQPVAPQELLPEGDRILLNNFHAAPEAVRAGVKTTLSAFANEDSERRGKKAA